MENYPPTPELNRMAELGRCHSSQSVGAFLDWLTEAGYIICEWLELEWDLTGSYLPANRTINQWLHEWLGIDADKCEAERKAVLEYLRGSANDVEHPGN